MCQLKLRRCYIIVITLRVVLYQLTGSNCIDVTYYNNVSLYFVWGAQDLTSNHNILNSVYAVITKNKQRTEIKSEWNQNLKKIIHIYYI